MTLATTPIVPTTRARGRRSPSTRVTAVIFGLLASLLSLGLQAGPALAGSTTYAVTQPFWVEGVVSQVSAPVDPGSVEAANAAFILNPVNATSGGGVDPYIGSDGSLKIYVTPNTSYYLEDGNGVWKRSDYAHAIVQGATLRVNGDRYTQSTGAEHFVAKSVFNPPPPESSGGGATVPKCGSDTNPFHFRKGNYALVAYITSLKAHYPCTKIGNYAGGITVGNFQTSLAPQVARAAVAYGGNNLEISITEATKYIYGNKTSTFSKVVKPGAQVFVSGGYVYELGAWTFVAKTVWTPAPTPGDPTATTYYTNSVDINAAATTDGGWEGRSQGGNATGFPSGTFQSNLAWTQNGTDWNVTGTWVIFDGNGNAERGTVDGYTSGTDLQLSFEITGGEGTQMNAQGGGDLDGSISPTPPGIAPSAFSGHAIFQVIFPSSANA